MTTKTGHTPGPWTISSGTLVVRNGAIIANCLNIDSISPTSDLNELEANARLIAAAPELKFYLEDLIEQINQFPEIAKGINMTYAIKALAKATGEGEGR